MRKRTRKLSLQRETLRHLDPDSLRRAGGGNPLDTTTGCEEASHCACETDGCGTTGSTCPSVTNCSNC